MKNENALFENAPEQLAAQDMLSRRLPTDEIARPAQPRAVGLFYFLWCGEHGRGKPYDISEITKADPEAGYHTDSPLWGGVGTYHHWGEPFYGYYYSDDEWVIRRHMMLLCDAGVDFLYFDTTNAVIYEKNVKIVLSVLQEYHDAGIRIPKIMFYTNTASGATVGQIYNAVYKPAFCPDTWYCYEGKPVIIAVKEECSAEAQAFFNIKMSQWPNEPDKRGGWPWMDFTRPQRVFENLDGIPEVINVSVAQHPQLRFGDSVLYGETGNCGRAYHNGANDPAPDAFLYGYNFGEQLDRAVEADPPVVLLTGWNEWIAGRWPGIPERPIMFVDCANAEYSRDIEMMRGGYFDNYYLQMIAGIRRYKGQNAPVPSDDAVYYHAPNGNLHRDHDGYDCHFTNTTGRNALKTLKLHKHGARLSVTAEAYDVLKNDRRGSFMELRLIPDNGNGTPLTAKVNGETGSLYETETGRMLAAFPVTLGKTSVTYELPTQYLRLSAPLWIKACDSTEEIRTNEDFYDKGDTMPAGRLYFVYRAAQPQR